MEKINFDPEYVDAILKGEKKTTVRKGIKNYSGRVLLTSDGEVFGEANIKKVVVKRVKELSEEDAKMDGFENLQGLINALKQIYGDIEDSEFVTVIHFEILE